MKVTGFDGKEHNFNYIKNKNRKGLSKLHNRAKSIIKKIYGSYPIYEEVSLPGSKIDSFGKILIADFFIPEIMLIVESHGEQHFRYIPHFHGALHEGGKMKFSLSKIRDKKKKEWCEINNIDLVELLYNETEDQWEKKLTSMRPMD